MALLRLICYELICYELRRVAYTYQEYIYSCTYIWRNTLERIYITKRMTYLNFHITKQIISFKCFTFSIKFFYFLLIDVI